MAQKDLQLSENAIRKIAEVVISRLERIDSDWQQPWLGQGLMMSPRNLYAPTPLRGMNAILLSMLCEMKSWKTPYFLTFNQIANRGDNFKYKDLELLYTQDAEGKKHYEESFPVIKWVLTYYNPEASPSFISPSQYDDLQESDKESWRPIFNKRVFNEFNLEQTNFPQLYPEDFERLVEQCQLAQGSIQHQENCDDAVLNEMIENGHWITNRIHLEGDKAFFRPSSNEIWLPPRETFSSSSSFYGTAMHEMIHSTGPVLGRDMGNGFGSKSYAMEELVAEFGAAINAMQLGIEKTVDLEHLQYIKAWIEAIHEQPDILANVVNDTMKASNFFLRHYEQVQRELSTCIELPKFQLGDYEGAYRAVQESKERIHEDLKSKGSCLLQEVPLLETPDQRRLVADIKLMGDSLLAVPERLCICTAMQSTPAGQILQDMRDRGFTLFDVPQKTMEDALSGCRGTFCLPNGKDISFSCIRDVGGYGLRFLPARQKGVQLELDFSAAM